MSTRERFGLGGRFALVTGASGGLGAHFAGVLSAAGARVAIAARRVDRLESLAASLRAQGGEVMPVELDVTDAASVSRCFDALAAWGVPDIVVNNAGIGVARPLLEQREKDYDRVLDTNLKGVFLVSTEAARRWVAAGRAGCIVNVASILGVRVATGIAPYAMSKAGVVQATKAMALELAPHGIRVNALVPGYIETDWNREFMASDAGAALRDRIPSRRFGEPQDLDGPLLLLVSDAGRAMTGSTVEVDSGHLVSAL